MSETIEKFRDLLANHEASLFSVFGKLGIGAPVTPRNVLVAYNLYGRDFTDALEASMGPVESFDGFDLNKVLSGAVNLFQTASDIKKGFQKPDSPAPAAEAPPAPPAAPPKKILGLSVPLFVGVATVAGLLITFIIISIVKR